MTNLVNRIDQLKSELEKWKSIQENTTDSWMKEYCTPFLNSLETRIQVLESAKQSVLIAKGDQYVD